MLIVKINVRYENDWTSDLAEYDVFGQFLAATFRDREYLGLVVLDAAEEDVDDVMGEIRDHEYTISTDVLEEYGGQDPDRVSTVVFVHAEYMEYTPLQILIQEGYLPYGGFGELSHGTMSYDVLMEDREALSDTVDLLERLGTVRIDLISEDFQYEITPSSSEWSEFLGSIPTRQRQILRAAVDLGYFEIPREVTLDDLADEVGIATTTASHHLRKAQRQVLGFVTRYMNLVSEN